jgi:hypothetical protein
MFFFISILSVDGVKSDEKSLVIFNATSICRLKPENFSKVKRLNQKKLYFRGLRKILFLKLFLRWAGPRPHIPFPPDLIFVCKFSRHGFSSSVTSHLAPSITVLVFPDSADAYSHTTASYRLTQLFWTNTRE